MIRIERIGPLQTLQHERLTPMIRPPARRPVSAAERREWLLFLLLVGPNFLLFAVFTYWPLIYNAYLSFVRWDMLAPIKLWVGLNNYRELFALATFWRMLTDPLVFTFGSVLAICILGLLMALLLNQPLFGRNAVRSIVFSPVMLSGVAVGFGLDLHLRQPLWLDRWFCADVGRSFAKLAVRPGVGDDGGVDCPCLEECRLCGGDLSGWSASHLTRVVRGRDCRWRKWVGRRVSVILPCLVWRL